MVKTRGINIRRTVKVLSEDKKGNVTETKVQKNFPCKVNASVPFTHWMCENNRFDW